MSTNLELVRSLMPEGGIDFVELVNSPDPAASFPATTGAISPDIEVQFAGAQAGGPGRGFEGIEGLLEGWRDWLLPYHSYRITAEEYIDAGENIVMHAHVAARTERHGVDIEHDPSSVWTVKDGRIVAVRFFLDRDEALAFAGLGQEQVPGER